MRICRMFVRTRCAGLLRTMQASCCCSVLRSYYCSFCWVHWRHGARPCWKTPVARSGSEGRGQSRIRTQNLSAESLRCRCCGPRCSLCRYPGQSAARDASAAREGRRLCSVWYRTAVRENAEQHSQRQLDSPHELKWTQTNTKCCCCFLDETRSGAQTMHGTDRNLVRMKRKVERVGMQKHLRHFPYDCIDHDHKCTPCAAWYTLSCTLMRADRHWPSRWNLYHSPDLSAGKTAWHCWSA